MPAAASSSLLTPRLCSQAGAKSSDDEDLNDEGFSDPKLLPEALNSREFPPFSDDKSGGDAVDYFLQLRLTLSKLKNKEKEAESRRLKRIELEIQANKAKAEADSRLFEIIMDTREPVAVILNKWVEEGNSIDRDAIVFVMSSLRKHHAFGEALQLMEWLADNKHMDFEEYDYSSHLDLIAKVRGLCVAEKFIEKIPESYRSERVYGTLLASAVNSGHHKKAEEIFNKIRDAGFANSAAVYNYLLLVYKRTDPKKTADVLALMEKENIEPTSFTYKLLIDVKGRAKDISGMEEIVEKMKSEYMNIDLATKATIARHYMYARQTEKAEAVLKEIEGLDIKNNEYIIKSRPLLLRLYSSLGKVKDVERVWKVCCEFKPRLQECVSAIQAFGDIGNVEKAEEVFELMLTAWKSLSLKHYKVLLMVYAKHQLLSKGKEFAKRMENDGCKICPFTCDALVKLYVGAGEVEKAESMIQKAVKETNVKPFDTSYITVMEKYAQRGDVHNAEKIFLKLKEAGYEGRMRQYQTLIEAYMKAKVPAYGLGERMQADKIVPNRYLMTQLNAIDAFKKTPISDLLD